MSISLGDNMKFYLTFPPEHRNHDRYRVIEAESYHDAYCEAVDMFGNKFAGIHTSKIGLEAKKLGPTIKAKKWKTKEDYEDNRMSTER